jgi:hypothetical protein
MFNASRAGSRIGHPEDNPPEPYHDPPKGSGGFFVVQAPSQALASHRSMHAMSSSVSTGLVT